MAYQHIQKYTQQSEKKTFPTGSDLPQEKVVLSPEDPFEGLEEDTDSQSETRQCFYFVMFFYQLYKNIKFT